MDELLKILKTDARKKSAELGALLNLGEEEVRRRIADYEKRGVILGYQALVDNEKAGDKDVTAMVEVKITPERGGGFDRLAGRIAKFDEVQSCYLVSGGYDLLVIVQGENLQVVAKFIAEKLSTIKGVLSTATRFRLKAYKENGALIAKDGRTARLAVAP
jgi:DNA-binding Lrp family transcriptional regulator